MADNFFGEIGFKKHIVTIKVQLMSRKLTHIIRGQKYR